MLKRYAGNEVNVKYSRTLSLLLVGTFDKMDAADAFDDNAFALQGSDPKWNCFNSGDSSWIPAFRAYLTSSSIERTSYESRYTE